MVRISVWSSPAVADGLAGGVNSTRQRRLGNDTAAPDRIDQFVLGDDVIAALQQTYKYIEHLRFNRDRLGAAAQFASIPVKYMVGKEKLHVAVRSKGCF